MIKDINYSLPKPKIGHVVINRAMVQEKLHEKVKEVDVDKYIL